MVDLLVPPPEDTGPGKLTVGKVYGGMLILENWKLSRFGQGHLKEGLQESLITVFSPLMQGAFFLSQTKSGHLMFRYSGKNIVPL